MGTLIINKNEMQVKKVPLTEEETWFVPNTILDRFSPEILGLGKIGQPSKQTQALAAFFDLEGFTNFCKQIDPRLPVPEYLNGFLGWLFDRIKSKSIITTEDTGAYLYHVPPFMAKFMGDGVLFLWNTDYMSDIDICNVIINLSDICYEYNTDFYPTIRKKVSSPPKKLRCGIARGDVYSIGDGNDFVGPCINVAARLQKFAPSLSFCFSRRGINYEENMNSSSSHLYITKKVQIRGIGDDELICVIKAEFNKIVGNEKDLFGEP